jgi:AICAR transformylase/IMP cyclohydrolase PurH
VCFPIQLTTRRSDQRSKKYSTELEKQGGAQLEALKMTALNQYLPYDEAISGYFSEQYEQLAGTVQRIALRYGANPPTTCTRVCDRWFKGTIHRIPSV